MYGIFVSPGVLSGTGSLLTFYPPKLPYLPARLARLAAVEAAAVRFVIDLYCTLGKHSK
jgi:hypothetical protein